MGDLRVLCPSIEDNLSKWDKEHKITKARVFLKEDLGEFIVFLDSAHLSVFVFLVRFMECPNNEHNMPLKMFSVTAIAFAGRGCEVFGLPFDSVSKCVDSKDGSEFYSITYERCSKSPGPGNVDGLTQYVKGPVEMKVISDYPDCFPPEARKGRLFRKMCLRKGKIVATNSVIGHNTAAEYGKVIAKALGLPDPERYTGHCWRGTAATWAANDGLSLPQIKALTNHKSDSVVQEYIHTSTFMKGVVANAVSMKRPTDSESSNGSPTKEVFCYDY